jgi:hypothetical protein
MRGQMTHPDTDVLAEFRAGLITGRRATRIAAHLAGCERCTAVDDTLAGVSALLASVPAPAMPDSVAHRLDTVLAAEVARRDDPERAGDDGSRDRATHRRPAAHWGFRLVALRILAPAAAVVTLAAGGYGLSLIGGGSQMQAASSSAGGAASAAGSASAASGANKALPAAGAPVPSAAPIRSAALSPRFTAQNFPFAVSDTNFSSDPATRLRQVKAELAVPLTSRPTRAAPQDVRACVQKLVGGHPVLLVESAFFEGRPTTLIVARTGQDDTAWIAAPACSATNRDVLATTSLPAGISGP